MKSKTKLTKAKSFKFVFVAETPFGYAVKGVTKETLDDMDNPKNTGKDGSEWNAKGKCLCIDIPNYGMKKGYFIALTDKHKNAIKITSLPKEWPVGLIDAGIREGVTEIHYKSAIKKTKK